MATQARIALVTHPVKGARAFARRLVDARLAACVNLVPLASIYRWQGKVESAREVLLVIKTSDARVRALERHVRAAHPYDVPEVVVLAPEHVEARYLAWVLAESHPRGRTRRR